MKRRFLLVLLIAEVFGLLYGPAIAFFMGLI